MDAENAVRGFLLTHDAAYLDPDRKAQSELPRRLESLKDGIRDSPSLSPQMRAGRPRPAFRTENKAVQSGMPDDGVGRRPRVRRPTVGFLVGYRMPIPSARARADQLSHLTQ